MADELAQGGLQAVGSLASHLAASGRPVDRAAYVLAAGGECRMSLWSAVVVSVYLCGAADSQSIGWMVLA